MSQQIRLEDHVYERIKATKRDDESFSEAVERLIGRRSLRDLPASGHDPEYLPSRRTAAR